MNEREAVHREEAVLRPDHVLERLPERPFPLRRRAVQVLGAHSRKHAGEIAVRLVVLREDPLRLRRLSSRASRELHREVAQLVVGHEQREAKPLLVIDAPLPLAAHVLIGERHGRADQVLDRLRDGLQSARTGTPAIVSSAMLSTTSCR